MEYNLLKHSSAYCDKFLDTVNEQIVDADITLPDYCPDIEKILKCTLIPKIYTRNICGGQLSVDGIAVVRILYCDGVKHNVRSFEHSCPFAATFNLKSTPQQYIVHSFAKCEYINCRALSPRKLSVHAAFSLYAKVLSKDSCDFYGFDDDCDLQTKQQQISVSDLCAMCQEQFSFVQDISVGANVPVQTMLAYDTAVRITQLKSIHSKLMLSAVLELKIMYLSDLDSRNIEHLTSQFEINRVFDCDSVSDECTNIPQLEIMSSDVSVKNDALSDGTELSLDVKLCFSNISYCQKDLSIIDDVYSTEYKTESKRSMLSCESNHSLKTFANVVQTTVDFDSTKITQMLDVYCENVTASVIISDEKMTLQGKTNACMLFADEQGAANYIERSVDFEFLLDADRSFDKVELYDAVVKSISFRLVSDNKIELRLEIVSDLILCDSMSLNPIVAVERLDDSKIEKDDCSLVMYFADKGEDVWDIAKMYNTRKSLLISENSLDTDKLEENRMLLVVTE